VDEFYIHQNQLVGAVFDNIMFAVSRNIDLALEVSQIDQPFLKILGGISRFKLLNQRFADLHSIPINYSTKYEASIEGLFILCDIASGKIKDLTDYQKLMDNNEDLRSLEPRLAMTSILQEKYKKWVNITKIG
jgi:sugar (pentulose or hexulose) kinase